MEFDVSYPAAFVAGVLSFLSPCLLPLIPPYLGFIGGVTLEQLAGDAADSAAVRRRVGFAAIAFVLGFATVFVALGASASALYPLIADHLEWLSVAGGAVIVVLGLHFIGLIRLRWLDVDARHHPAVRPAGLVGAYVVGFAFAFGWSPCVGPVLATILTIAAGQDEVWRGAALLSAYAAGIGLPFLAAAVFAGTFLAVFRSVRRYLRAVEIGSGVLLIATGGLIMSGRFGEMGVALLRLFPALGRIG